MNNRVGNLEYYSYLTYETYLELVCAEIEYLEDMHSFLNDILDSVDSGGVLPDGYSLVTDLLSELEEIESQISNLYERIAEIVRLASALKN